MGEGVNFQMSLAILANTITDEEKAVTKNECEKFILRGENLSKKFKLCTKQDHEWVLNYLATGKRTIPYEIITRYNSLNISSKTAIFSFHTTFILALKTV